MVAVVTLEFWDVRGVVCVGSVCWKGERMLLVNPWTGLISGLNWTGQDWTGLICTGFWTGQVSGLIWSDLDWSVYWFLD